eukprot:1985899-Rhodomonas_salina.2
MMCLWFELQDDVFLMTQDCASETDAEVADASEGGCMRGRPMSPLLLLLLRRAGCVCGADLGYAQRRGARRVCGSHIG